ncbi:MAG: hypothetical protein MPJ24_05240 [Pirellulaceae bacterium]|nr:hypothetical protein [Pirellulaceae bacterium]
MADFTKHQQNIIRNYYDNRESISLQKIQELVTELYLSTGRKRAQYWKNIAGHLEKLDVPQSKIDKLIEQDDPAKVVTIIEPLLKK